MWHVSLCSLVCCHYLFWKIYYRCTFFRLRQECHFFTLILFPHIRIWELHQNNLPLFLLAADQFHWMTCTCIWWKGYSQSLFYFQTPDFPFDSRDWSQSQSCVSNPRATVTAWIISTRTVKTRWAASAINVCIMYSLSITTCPHTTAAKLQHQPDFFCIHPKSSIMGMKKAPNDSCHCVSVKARVELLSSRWWNAFDCY